MSLGKKGRVGGHQLMLRSSALCGGHRRAMQTATDKSDQNERKKGPVDIGKNEMDESVCRWLCHTGKNHAHRCFRIAKKSQMVSAEIVGTI